MNMLPDPESRPHLRQVWPLLFSTLLVMVSCAEGPTTPVREIPEVLAFVTVYDMGSRSGRVWLLDAKNDTYTNTVFELAPPSPSRSFDPEGIAVTPDRTKVYVTNPSSKSMTVIDVASAFEGEWGSSDAVRATIPVETMATSVAVTPDGSKIYVADVTSWEQTGHLTVIDAASDRVTAGIPVGGLWAYRVAISPDGRKAYVTNQSLGAPDHVPVVDTADHVTVVDVATDSVTSRIPVGPKPRAIAVTPNVNKIYVTHYVNETDNISVVDVASEAVTKTLSISGTPWDVTVTPNGTKAYVSTGAGIFVIDVATDDVTATVPVEASGGLAVTPDGTKLYAATAKGKVSVIDVATDTITKTRTVGGSGKLARHITIR